MPNTCRLNFIRTSWGPLFSWTLCNNNKQSIEIDNDNANIYDVLDPAQLPKSGSHR